MKWLKAKCGTRFRVDDAVWEWAKDCQWYLKNGYPCRYITSTRYGMKDNFESMLHRELLHYPMGVVHHVDGNPLNVQRRNLEVKSVREHQLLHRVVERSRRNQRQSPPRSSSGYKGVSWHKTQQRWVTQLSVNGKNVQLGSTRDPEEAALLYDAAVLAFVGPGAYTNLIPFEENRTNDRG